METDCSLLKSHLVVQICAVSYVEYFVGFWENTFGGALFKKVATLNAVNSVIEDSVMDIFLKILPVFQKAPVFTIFESTFCLWKNLTLILWYIGLGFVKYLNYLTGLGLVLYYIGVREGAGGFYKFFKKDFIAQKTIELNISWPSNSEGKYFMAPPINFSFLFKAC